MYLKNAKHYFLCAFIWLTSGIIFVAFPAEEYQVVIKNNVECLPEILITEAPEEVAGPSSWGNIQGVARNVNPSACRVVIYARTDKWYVQPWVDKPCTSIAANGKWQTGIHLGSVYAALLVKADYCKNVPSTLNTLPPVGGDILAIDVAEAKRRIISFSGFDWKVKHTLPNRFDPGPNFFSNHKNNVCVDSRGRLHLKITRQGGNWHCAEISLLKSLGYGAYRFYLDSRVDNLDPNAVLGLFTYDENPEYGHREIDIEFSRWGNPADENTAQYVIQPFHIPGNMMRFNIPAKINKTLNYFIWHPKEVFFQSLKGHPADPFNPCVLIFEWTFTQEIPPAGKEKVHINLWLFNGNPPLNNKPVEVIINRFEFVPGV